jgi:VAD1 Analog of StAR-related lipid transfer domain
MGKQVFPLTLSEFYETFLASDAPWNFFSYYQAHKNYKDLRVENVTKNESLGTEEYHLNMIIPIQGVPFCKQSRLNRIVRIDQSDKQLIAVDFENRTLDVPYGDHFYQVERWYIAAPS